MMKSKGIALVGLGLVAGLVLGSLGVSYAATSTEDATASCGVQGGIGRAVRDAGGRLVDVVADLTGLTVEEVQAQRADGKSAADIAEASGVSKDAVVDAALASRKAVLDAKVADGSITADQADAAYARMTERVTERVTSSEPGSSGACGEGAGQGRGRGRMGGLGACGGRAGVAGQ